MDRYLVPLQPPASTPDPAKMAPAASGAPGHAAQREGEQTAMQGHDMPPFSPPSDLSPCLPRSLSMASLDSPDHSGLPPWFPHNSQLSQRPSRSGSLIPGPNGQAALASDTQGDPPLPPAPALLGDKAILALLQNLPTKADFSCMAARIETTLRHEIAGVKRDVSATNERVTTLASDVTSLTTDVSGLQAAHDTLADRVAQLQLLVDDLENRNRRRNIRIRDLPEATGQADLKATVTAIFNACLDRAADTVIAIDRVHRTLGPRSPTENRPRDVLCCLHNYSVREDVLQASWRKGSIDFDGAQVTLLPDVSRKTFQMRRCLRPLLEHLTERRIPYKWGHPFHLIVRKNGRPLALRHPSEVPSFLEALGLPSVQVPDWLAPVVPQGAVAPTNNPSTRPQRVRRHRRSQRQRSQAPQDREP